MFDKNGLEHNGVVASPEQRKLVQHNFRRSSKERVICWANRV